MSQNKLIVYGREHHCRFTAGPLIINYAPILQSAPLQNGGGEITCAQILPLLSLQERNVGNQEHVQLKQP